MRAASDDGSQGGCQRLAWRDQIQLAPDAELTIGVVASGPKRLIKFQGQQMIGSAGNRAALSQFGGLTESAFADRVVETKLTKAIVASSPKASPAFEGETVLRPGSDGSDGVHRRQRGQHAIAKIPQPQLAMFVASHGQQGAVRLKHQGVGDPCGRGNHIAFKNTGQGIAVELVAKPELSILIQPACPQASIGLDDEAVVVATTD